MVIAWSAWIGALAAIVLLFWWLWRFAERIEQAEYEEEQWREYINYLWQSDPAQAQYWQYEYERKFLGAK